MMLMKAQTQVVSVVIIVALAMTAIGAVLPWATNMIQKKKDTKSLEDVYNFFEKLDETIRHISNIGGEESLTLDVPGKMTIYPESANSPLNNSIVFFFQGKVSNVAEGGWIPLNTPNPNKTATLGIDTPSVIFAKSERSGKNMNVWYRLWYRELVNPAGDQGYIIVLNTSDNTVKSTTTGFLRIRRLGSKTISGTKTLTITEINIIV